MCKQKSDLFTQLCFNETCEYNKLSWDLKSVEPVFAWFCERVSFDMVSRRDLEYAKLLSWSLEVMFVDMDNSQNAV